MDFGGGGGTRVIGDYILGPKIGSGSFAVVWRSRHRKSGTVVAVKEIDKKQLSPKVSENLFKEITILSTIDHPNIIRLFEAIQTKDRIYLVLEYCSGGDLAAYIHRHGKVSEATARHFMIQLAAGLQVLQEKNLIHRDLKPQNLLLATSGATPLMKIGDFGFARSLTPQGLADTLCGSPLYMAPEIIQNKKYDAKADLWSVGAILFQLVTGKPPFDGNSQLQLFQNILTSSEPQFPQEALKELHSDCLDLCKGLLRRNPVERLTFKEFFNHNFLQEPRLIMHVEQSLLHPSERSVVQHLVTSTSDMSQLHSGHHVESLVDDPVVVNSVLNDTLALQRNTGKKTIGIQAVETPVFGCSHLSKEPQVSRLMESIEKDYVLVNHHFASLEAFSEYFEASVQDNSTCKVSICSSKRTNTETGVPMQTNDPSHCHAGELENPKSGEPVALAASRAFDVLSKMHGTSSLSSSNRLELLHLYVQILAELSCEKYNAKLYLESFAVELVVLAIWKKALEVCESWMNMGVLPASTLANEARTSYGDVGSSQNMEKKINFRDPLSVYMWAKEGFIAAVDSAQTLSRHIQNMDGEAEMPDAMEIIFQEALLVGKSGAVDEYMENRGRAAASYSKAMLLLSFIVGEATNLPLNPPFLLTAANEKRILQYIHNLQFHQKSSSDSSPKATHILLSE